MLAVVGSLFAACTPAPDPFSPRDLATSLTDSGFDVSWSAVNGATSYELRHVDADTPDAEWISSQVTAPGASIGGLVSGHHYKFIVRATVSGTERPWSASIESLFVVPTLPVVRLETTDHAPIVSRDVYLTGDFSLDPGDGSPVSTSTMQVKGRGNTTWEALKKPYRLKLDTSTPLLGMPKSKNWVLLADYFDPTHLRNSTAFALGNETSLAWTPRTRQVELVLNGIYQGVYALTEHVRIDGSRVDIDEMSEDDIAGDALTGGYLAEIENKPPRGGEHSFVSSRGLRIHVGDPEVPTPEQAAYIRTTVNAFETALHSPGLVGYRDHLDVASMIDYYLVSEVARNQDAFGGSTYFTKPRLGPLTMGPLWDFDNSMGNDRGWDTGEATGWFVRRPGLAWIGRMFDDPTFVTEVAARWQELKPRFEQVADQVIANGDAIAEAMAHELMIWPYRETPIDTPQELSDWLHTRIDWIDANIEPAP